MTELIAAIAEPLAAIIYNASGFGGPLLAADPEELAVALQVSLFSLLEVCRAGRTHLERTRGAVITTGGGFALYPSAELGVLSLAKAASRTASLLLAQELAPSGITVRTVTIAGTVAPGGPFDSKAIAATFLAALDQPGPEVMHTGG